MRKLTLEEFQQKINEIHPREKLIALTYNGDSCECSVMCKKCGNIYVKKAGYFKDKRKVSICKTCFPTQPNKIKTNYVPPKNYELVGEYKGMQNKTLVRHKTCGFIWNVKLNNLEHGKGCPKCNKKMSKGEQRIVNWLNINHIKFESQKKIDIDCHHLSIDFYLPDYELFIEYNGEQHYNPIAFFGGEQKFKKQIENDNLKKYYLKEKLLIISYLDFNNIESILESSTTIRKRSRP